MDYLFTFSTKTEVFVVCIPVVPFYRWYFLNTDWVSGISGMEYWNGILEWNTGME